MFHVGCSTAEMVGRSKSAHGIVSNPATATSSGTRSPRSDKHFDAPIVTRYDLPVLHR
jgi:hypothetical protein